MKQVLLSRTIAEYVLLIYFKRLLTHVRHVTMAEALFFCPLREGRYQKVSTLTTTMVEP